MISSFYSRAYELWEILKDGQHGEVYEVVSCSVPDYVGSQVKVITESNHTGEYKALVRPDVKGLRGTEEDLVTLYGCLVTAKYKKVLKYRAITVQEALSRLGNNESLYVLHEGEYVLVNKWQTFETLDFKYVYNLYNSTFYIKEEF